MLGEAWPPGRSRLWPATPAAAERAARRTHQLLEQLGETGFRSLAAGQLASSLYALEQLDEAELWTKAAEELTSSDDVTSNMLWRQVRAKLLARSGQHAAAERLAREAVGLGEETDMLNWHANALADLAEVLVLAGGPGAGNAPLEQALALYESKGNLVSAASARSRLDDLRPPACESSNRRRSSIVASGNDGGRRPRWVG